MSQEVSYQFQIYLSNSGLKDHYASGSLSADQASAKLIRNVQNIGTGTHEVLALGDVTTLGFAVFQNLDDTNYVEIGIDVSGTFYSFLKLLAGEQCMCKLGVTAVYAKANTGAVDLYYVIYSA